MSSQNANQQPLQKKSRGRQKIKIEKIQNETNRQVTFSKRKAGLFKKASELCTLCGVEGAVVLFSPANKSYCFGHPSVEAIIQRYQDENINNNADPIDQRREVLIEAHRTSNICGLNTELTSIESMARAEKGQEEELDMMKKIGQAQKWFPRPLEELSYSELCRLKESVLKFKYDMGQKVCETMKKGAINAAAVANAVPANTTVTTSTTTSSAAFDNINSAINYNDFSTIFDPYRAAVPGRLDQSRTRGVSIFDVNNSPSVPQQFTATYAALPQVSPYDNVNSLPPFAPNFGSSNDLGLGNFYSGLFESGESSQHHHQASNNHHVPLAGSDYFNTTGLSAYDQQMIGGFGHVASDYNPNYESSGKCNLGNNEEQYGVQMNAGGPGTYMASSSNNQLRHNDQLYFDQSSLGGANHQVTFDPNSNTRHDGVDGNGEFGGDGPSKINY